MTRGIENEERYDISDATYINLSAQYEELTELICPSKHRLFVRMLQIDPINIWLILDYEGHEKLVKQYLKQEVSLYDVFLVSKKFHGSEEYKCNSTIDFVRPLANYLQTSKFIPERNQFAKRKFPQFIIDKIR